MMKLNGPLCTSIITTSLLGGYMTYVYPRKIIYYEKGEKKSRVTQAGYPHGHRGASASNATAYSIICVVRPMTNAYAEYTPYLPASLYALANYVRGRTLADIYGISSHKLYFSSVFIVSCIGTYFHRMDAPRLYQKIARK